jgi:ComF family protein
VCGACWASILPLTPPLCDACGDPLPTLNEALANESSGIDDGWRTSPICRRCHGATHLVSRARAVGAYDGALRIIVHALKYDARRSLARHLGELMRARGADILQGATCVVPVPLHPSRRRERGFNQARDLARHLGLPVVEALARVRSTAPQAELTAVERRRNLEGAFAATRHARRLIGSTIVLVDDVSTTGTTLDGCALALKNAGIADVRALTAARVVGAGR